MTLVIDTSAIISVITNEPHKKEILGVTKGRKLIAPYSVHWEIGNAFSAMLKRNRIRIDQALACIDLYQKIPIRYVEIELTSALELVEKLQIYAYDAYLISCSQKYKSSLLTLDNGLTQAAQNQGITVLEVEL